MKFRPDASKLVNVGIMVAGMGFLQSAQAFFRMPCSQPIVVERADPILNPGAVSGHLHTVMGSSGFNFTEDYDAAVAGTCTSCMAAKDHSNYWVPSLFYQAQNGSVHRVDLIGGALIYYLQRTDPAKPNEVVTPFPRGFRMFAGDPYLRSYNDTLEQRAVSWVCLDYSGTSPQTPNIPNNNCPNGLRAQIFFPSCSDGRLDSPDHKSHMAYPSGMDSGSCPSTHPTRLVSIFYEYIWDTNPWKDMWWKPGGSHPFVLASGDTTGYAHHGDFINGWDEDALATAVTKCTQQSGNIEDCAADLELLTDAQTDDCVNPSRVNEITTGWLPSLPGCNPITSGPARATPVQDGTCGKPVPAILSADQVGFFKKTVPFWDPVGCAADSITNRLLPNKFTDPTMTIEKCVNLCQSNGFKYAGAEWGVECWCGNTFDESKANLDGSCSQPCAGDPTEMCGHAAILSVYKYDPNKSSGPTTSSSKAPAPAVPTTTTTSIPRTTTTSSSAPPPSSSSSTASTKVPAGWIYRGCYFDQVNPRSLSGSVMYIGVPMTPSACTDHCTQGGFAIAGTEYAGECYCGNSFTGGAVLKPDSDCNMPCKGDSTVMCGGPARLSVYSKDMRSFKRDSLSDGFDLLEKREDQALPAKRDQGIAHHSKRHRAVHGRSRIGI